MVSRGFSLCCTDSQNVHTIQNCNSNSTYLIVITSVNFWDLKCVLLIYTPQIWFNE